MAFDARAVVNYFLELAAADRKPLTPMKAQKLVYYAHGWHLALTGDPLIDEQVEAWPYGPVIPSLYHAVKHYGDGPITAPVTRDDWHWDDGAGPVWDAVTPTVPAEPERGDFTRRLLRRVWDLYGPYTAVQLSNMTHTAGGPWDQVRDHYDGRIPRGTDIPAESIRVHFRRLIEAGRQPA